MKSEKKNKRLPVFIILSGALCLLIAGVIILHNMQESVSAGNASSDAAEYVIDRINEQATSEADDETPSKEPVTGMKTVEYNGYSYMGVLNIPSINLTLPVISSYDFSYLTVSPCLYYGDPADNNAIICAHNYRSHFGPVRRLPTGTYIFLSTVSGGNYQYIVESIELIGSGDAGVLINDNPGLTLFTCTTGGAARYAIRCSLVNNSIQNLYD